MSAIVPNPDYPEDGSGFKTVSAITKHCHFHWKLFHCSTVVIFLFHISQCSLESQYNYIMHHLEVPYNQKYCQSLGLVLWPKTGKHTGGIQTWQWCTTSVLHHKYCAIVITTCQSGQSVGQQLTVRVRIAMENYEVELYYRTPHLLHV